MRLESVDEDREREQLQRKCERFGGRCVVAVCLVASHLLFLSDMCNYRVVQEGIQVECVHRGKCLGLDLQFNSSPCALHSRLHIFFIYLDFLGICFSSSSIDLLSLLMTEYQKVSPEACIA